jgi:hypothetical protein
MRFSEARKSYLAHAIVEAFRGEGLADVEERMDRHVLSEIKRVLDAEYEMDARVDAIVRRKIGSLSRQVPLGSPEWTVLYRKYYAEEIRKLRPGGA